MSYTCRDLLDPPTKTISVKIIIGKRTTMDPVSLLQQWMYQRYYDVNAFQCCCDQRVGYTNLGSLGVTEIIKPACNQLAICWSFEIQNLVQSSLSTK